MAGKQHFHSLDALRFFAFLKVYLLHVYIEGNFPIFGYLKSGGGIGVAFFFVLSGFLITYLLVYDKVNHGQISMGNFFMRRSFRIWPLFFLMVILAFSLPSQFAQDIGFHMVGGGYEPDWKYSFTFTENYHMLIQDNFPRTTPLPVFWSLCIEEHFYIVWMLVVFILPVKHFLKFLLGSFVIAWVCRYVEPNVWHNSTINTNTLFTNMDFFAAGGLVGYGTARHYEWISAKINGIAAWIKYAFIALVVLVVIFQKNIFVQGNAYRMDVIQPTIIALLFAGLVAVFVPADSTIRIRSKVLTYLGSISYGLYVYHIIFAHTCLQYCFTHGIKLDHWGTVAPFMAATFGGTVAVSVLSYHFFEMPFLRLRDRLSKQRSLS